jgi:hypothetical protein
MRISRLVQWCLVAVLAFSMAVGGAIWPVSHASAAPSLTLSRSTAAAGDQVTAIGYGFTAGDDVVISADMSVNNKAQHVETSGTAGSNGVVSETLTVPHGTNQGTYQVVARDFHGHSASHSLTILPNANVTAGSNGYTVYVRPGHSFYVSGSGFGANETVTIRAGFPLYNGNTTVVTHTQPTSNTGTFYEALLTAPRDAKAGILALTVTGQTSKKSGRDTLRVFYRPVVVVAASAYRPGTSIHATGSGFAPGASVEVGVTIPRTNSTNITISRTVSADATGHVSAYLPLPADTAVGTYAVFARENATGFHASTKVTVSVRPTIAATPGSVYPGQTVDVSGSNFGTGAIVRVVGQFAIGGGRFSYVTRDTRTGSLGNYFVRLPVPGNAATGSAAITASSGGARVTTHVQVRPRPTPVPKATATATATTAPTQAAPTATATPQPTAVRHHHPKLGYRYISIWYHTMTEGTREHVVVQSTIQTTQGIWVHVWFPAQGSYAFYENTDSAGMWSKWFLVPKGSSNAGNHVALITFRLWHGSSNIKEYQHFSIVK